MATVTITYRVMKCNEVNLTTKSDTVYETLQVVLKGRVWIMALDVMPELR